MSAAYLELLEMGDFKKDYLAQLTGHKFAAYARPCAPSSPSDMVVSEAAAATKELTSSRRPPEYVSLSVYYFISQRFLHAVVTRCSALQWS